MALLWVSDQGPLYYSTEGLGINGTLLTTRTGSTTYAYSPPNQPDVAPSRAINVSCNIAYGFLSPSVPRGVAQTLNIYRFNNSTERGKILDIAPNPIVPRLLNIKNFSAITA